ncbi:MAG: hypothetical protein PHC34_13495 [Candidatus Gastranaerophilales bacterium]|nr:hypothetical protein [Candidatus Gastranaerophilales bacterium]
MAVSSLGQNVNVISLNQKRQQSNVNRKAQFNNQLQKDSVSFSSKKDDYQNPVSKGWEYFSASIVPVITSTIAAVGAGFLFKKEGEKALLNKKVAAGVGLATLALTLPIALYHRSVSAFAKTKEMDVFSRAKSAETSLSEQIDQEARNEDVPLDESINHYMKFQIGKQGGGAIVNT